MGIQPFQHPLVKLKKKSYFAANYVAVLFVKLQIFFLLFIQRKIFCYKCPYNK